jgi:hypothetical protein
MPTTEPLPDKESALLAEFARACKAAARAVSLYPGTHPAIAVTLSRVVAATGRLVRDGRLVCTVLPDILVLEGQAPVRPDPAVVEVASLLHDRLVGELTIERDADADDWRALLLQLVRSTEDLIAEGGITAAWMKTGRSHFAIREIDYAEVLRERSGGDRAQWDRILMYCLQGDAGSLDDRALNALLNALGDSDRFGELLEHFQHSPSLANVSLSVRVAALLRLMKTSLEAAKNTLGDAENALQIMAASCAKLTAEMMLAMLRTRQSTNAEDAQMATAVAERMNDQTIAAFVARTVTEHKVATEPLAQAFDALVPELTRKEPILQAAHDEAMFGQLGLEDRFEQLWQDAATALMHSTTGTSEEYGKELTGAPAQALEVERVSDDPPERVRGWVATVTEAALRELDFSMLRDLVRIEHDAALWEPIATIVVSEIERRTLQGDAGSAGALAESLVHETSTEGRPQLRGAATLALERLAAGPLVRHVGIHLRKGDELTVEALNHLCHTIGAGVVKPLAELLTVEDNVKATRRLKEMLIGFGAAGRQSVEQLKLSSNPAVRRTAIDLLRVFGGQEALPELASMLDDADPQVQRESIRAIVQIGTNDAYAVLQRALVAGSTSRETVLQELLGLRDEKAAPLFCYVLKQTKPTGRLYRVHMEMIDTLGYLREHSDSILTLRDVLYSGSIWSPFKTAALRRSAAMALKRIGSPESAAVLDEAVAKGRRGVRNAAKGQLVTMRPETHKP